MGNVIIKSTRTLIGKCAVISMKGLGFFSSSKLLLLSLFLGNIITTITCWFEYEFCMAGKGHGIPCAILCPHHEESFSIELVNYPHGIAFYPLSIIWNVLCWSMLSFLSLKLYIFLGKRLRLIKK